MINTDRGRILIFKKFQIPNSKFQATQTFIKVLNFDKGFFFTQMTIKKIPNSSFGIWDFIF